MIKVHYFRSGERDYLEDKGVPHYRFNIFGGSSVLVVFSGAGISDRDVLPGARRALYSLPFREAKAVADNRVALLGYYDFDMKRTMYPFMAQFGAIAFADIYAAELPGHMSIRITTTGITVAITSMYNDWPTSETHNVSGMIDVADDAVTLIITRTKVDAIGDWSST